MYTVQALVPVLVISALYLKITATLKHIRLVPLALRPSRASSLNSTPSGSPRSSMVNINKLNMNPAGALRRQIIEKKFLTMLIAVLLVYVLCYLPFQTLYLIYEFNTDIYYLPYMQLLSDYFYVIVWLPNAINPVCYGCLNEHYKKAFKTLIFRPRKFFQTLRSRNSFSQSLVGTTAIRIR